MEMKEFKNAGVFMIPISEDIQKGPLYEQIYHYIKSEIISENLPFHSRLPSTRALARYMQISRSTIEMAYEQLKAEGYIEAVPYKGYYVAQINELLVLKPTMKKAEPEIVSKKEFCLYDFSPNGIDLENFPYSTWRKLSKNTLLEDKKELFFLGESQGDFSLRQTICSYLHQARGVNCTPEQIVIGAGNEYLLMLLHQLLPEKTPIAMENPTYKQAYRVLSGLGHPIFPIPMDKYGMKIGELEQTNANIAYVMPSHQFPLGVIMPIKRRLELLVWAKKRPGRYIIEDDYDGEFRYRGKPIPALQGIDQEGHVIYFGTFSRAIAPAIRISYMVLPIPLIEKYKNYYFYSSTVSRIDQTIIDIFIKEGHFERHLNRMRAIYKSKHDLVLNEWKEEKRIKISGENAGTHLLLTIKDGRTEEELQKKAMQAGVKLYGLSDYYISPEKRQEATLLFGYATNKEEELRNGIRLLKKAWKSE